MSNNQLTLIKKLRDELGAGMLDCKNAIEEAKGDYDLACEILRKKGIASAQKKASRDACDGLVGIKVQSEDSSCFALVKLNCETDFVARNEKFQNLLNKILDTLIQNPTNNLDDFLACKVDDLTVSELIMSVTGLIGEKISLEKVSYYKSDANNVATYIHNPVASSNMGKIAVAIAAKSNVKNPKIDTFLKQIAMHIAASNPIALRSELIDQKIIQKELEIYKEQVKNSGKPDAIADKIAAGKLQKFFEESVLLDQVFVLDGKTKVSDAIANFAKENNLELKIEHFVRFQVI
jgi:elongation factor Ts